MEFICALSVGGSLVYYHVQKESDERYSAFLRPGTTKSAGLPEEITLIKKDAEWEGHPPHDEVVSGLAQAIENGNR